MACDTLYTAQRLIIYLITFFGFNDSKPVLKALNVVIKVLAGILPLSIVIFITLLWSVTNAGWARQLIKESDGQKINKVFSFLKIYFGANVSCFLLCHFRKRKFNALLKILKSFDVSDEFSRKIPKFNFIFGAFFLCFSCIVWRELYRDEWSLFELCLQFILFSFTYVYLLCLPLCALPVCVVAFYINCTLQEKTEEVKRCESPLRKARMTTRLILLSTRLNRLTSVTNAYGAPLMLLLKMSAVTLSVAAIYCGLAHMEPNWDFVVEALVYCIPCLIFQPIYLWYLRVAPSANQIPSLMARVIMENVMSDEQGMARDPILRVQQLKTRFLHSTHLLHSNFNQKQFKTLNEPVDQADIFMVFVEIIDNLNSIKSAF